MNPDNRDPCWKGYDMIGMKDKNGKQVPNCVPTTKEKKARKKSKNAVRSPQGKGKGTLLRNQ